MQENHDFKKPSEEMVVPVAGNKIYVPRKESFDHPLHDVDGGLATIKDITKIEGGDYVITVEEHPNSEYRWGNLLSQQVNYSKEYNGKIAKRNPDTNVYSEKNDWKGGSASDLKKWIDNQ